jgi:hypothetical protein
MKAAPEPCENMHRSTKTIKFLFRCAMHAAKEFNKRLDFGHYFHDYLDYWSKIWRNGSESQ